MASPVAGARPTRVHPDGERLAEILAGWLWAYKLPGWRRSSLYGLDVRLRIGLVGRGRRHAAAGAAGAQLGVGRSRGRPRGRGTAHKPWGCPFDSAVGALEEIEARCASKGVANAGAGRRARTTRPASQKCGLKSCTSPRLSSHDGGPRSGPRGRCPRWSPERQLRNRRSRSVSSARGHFLRRKHRRFGTSSQHIRGGANPDDAP